jgi:hypothetical protein
MDWRDINMRASGLKAQISLLRGWLWRYDDGLVEKDVDQNGGKPLWA